ncbi:MAG: tetratricopeptide repeat protein [Verrucomicrobiota bacterium]
MNYPPKQPTRWSPAMLEAMAVALLLALVALLTWPAIRVPLFLDDLNQMTHVSGFTSWQNCIGRDSFGLFRPVKNLIYYGLGDLSLFNWHVLNLLVYLVSILSVYLFLKRLLGSWGWAFAAAAIWATCPTQVSTAVWMSAANISVAIVFTCACISFHDLSRQTSGRQRGLVTLTCLCLFLAECSYETAVVAPALCVLVDALRKRPLFSRAAIKHYAILAAVTLLYLAIRSRLGATHSQQGMNCGFAPDAAAWQLTLSAPWFLWKHFCMWLMPFGRIEFCSTYLWGISASYSELAAAWGGLMLLLGSIFFTWSRQPWVAFGLLWFLVTSFPTSNLIPIWAGPIEDYYLVFPGIGLTIALLGCAKALIDWIERERMNPASQCKLVGGILLGVGGLWRALGIPLFWLQADLWCRPYELYLRCDLTRPGQFLVQASAARELLDLGNLEQAKELAQTSYATGPWNADSAVSLGRIALQTADYDTAEKRFREVLRIARANTPVHDYSQLYLAKTFMAQESKRHLVRETLLPLLNNPKSPFHLNAIDLQIESYLARKLPNDALRAAAKAMQLHPDNAHFKTLVKDIEQKLPPPANPLPTARDPGTPFPAPIPKTN